MEIQHIPRGCVSVEMGYLKLETRGSSLVCTPAHEGPSANIPDNKRQPASICWVELPPRGISMLLTQLDQGR